MCEVSSSSDLRERRSPPEVRSRPEERNPQRSRSPSVEIIIVPDEDNADVAGPSHEEYPGWQLRTSRSSGRQFYYNRITRTVQWQPPGTQRRRTVADQQNLVTSTVEVEKDPVIRCSHLVIKHNETNRAVNWRGEPIVRSRVEAKNFIYDLRRRIANGESFEDLARIYSDYNSVNQCDLGRFRRGERCSGFENLAFGLKVGDISRIVESLTGYHIILRIE